MKNKLNSSETFIDDDVRKYYSIPKVLKIGLKCNKLTHSDVIFIKNIGMKQFNKDLWK